MRRFQPTEPKPKYRLTRRYAGVTVKQNGDLYAITDETGDPLVAVKPGTILCELDRDKVLDDEKTPIPPSGRYFRTFDTNFPYHIVLDIIDNTAVAYVGFN